MLTLLNKTPVFFDAEFTELSRFAKLLSIGLTCNGVTFYAEFNDYDPDTLSPWIKDNVMSHMIFNDVDHCWKEYKDTTIPEDPRRYKVGSVMMKGSTQEVMSSLHPWLEDRYSTTWKQLQFYMDCYAYDWMLFVDLLTGGKTAMDMLKSHYYIPMDLSTVMQTFDIDPDVNREEFLGPQGIQDVINQYPVLKMFGDDPKHNPLWDACVCQHCFGKIKDSIQE